MTPRVDCSYCKSPATLVDSSAFNAKSYGPVWACLPCEAYVGVHPGTTKPLGTLANRELRNLRVMAHRQFDRLWRERHMTRSQAYLWLKKVFDLSWDEAHIAMFGPERCMDLIEKLTGVRPPKPSLAPSHRGQLEEVLSKSSP